VAGVGLTNWSEAPEIAGCIAATKTSFRMITDDGRVVGLSTACLHDSSRCHVDGCAQQRFMDCWNDLIQAAIDWGES